MQKRNGKQTRLLDGKYEEAILSEVCELIEDYPTDPRGPSCLILGCTQAGLPIHLVCGHLQEEAFLVITIYRPDPAQWTDWKIRKETH
jgi:hypothetical protein